MGKGKSGSPGLGDLLELAQAGMEIYEGIDSLSEGGQQQRTIDPTPYMDQQFSFNVNTDWVFIAMQGQSFNIPTTQTYRYGTGDKWAVKELTGHVQVNDSTFGDPAPGEYKVCEMKVKTPYVQGNTWQQIVNCTEDSLPFSLPNIQYVRYGFGDVWLYKHVWGDCQAGPGFFGRDPVPNVVKSCEMLLPLTSYALLKAVSDNRKSVLLFHKKLKQLLFVSNDMESGDNVVESRGEFQERCAFILEPCGGNRYWIHNTQYNKKLFVSHYTKNGDNVVEARSDANEPRFMFQFQPMMDDMFTFQIYNHNHGKWLFVSNDLWGGDQVLEANRPEKVWEERNQFMILPKK